MQTSPRISLQSLRTLAPSEWKSWGNNEIAFIRQLETQDGEIMYGIFAADGTPVTAAPSLAHAVAMVKQQDIEPQMVH